MAMPRVNAGPATALQLMPGFTTGRQEDTTTRRVEEQRDAHRIFLILCILCIHVKYFLLLSSAVKIFNMDEQDIAGCFLSSGFGKRLVMSV